MQEPPVHPLTTLAIAAVRLYQMTLSKLLPSNICRFRPSCSQYMVDALKKYGFFVGLGRGLYRILRCNPFCRGGYDPA